jgi:hypothetical protein
VPRFYTVEASSRPQFATTSPTTGAPVMPIKNVSITASPPLPPSTSGNPTPISSSGAGASGGGKKKKRGFFRRVGRALGLTSVALIGSGGYCESS